MFGLQDVVAPRDNLLGEEGHGLTLAMGAFTGTAALVGIFGVALMRAAFDFALKFAKTEKRGGSIRLSSTRQSATRSPTPRPRWNWRAI